VKGAAGHHSLHIGDLDRAQSPAAVSGKQKLLDAQ
jgi:hypothetical protein